MKRTAVIAAMAAELEPLVRGWTRESRNGVDLWRRRHGDDEWIAACAGMGVNAASRAFAEIERDGPIVSVVSTGWAGALKEGFAAGLAYGVSCVVDAGSGERYPAHSPTGGSCLVTSPTVADHAEKRRLGSAFDADLVDMEASGIARLAAARGIPFHCVKGVSDGLDERLPDFSCFITADGKFQTARFVLFAILRPWLWASLARMGLNGRKAAQGIREAMLEILDPRKTPGSPDGPSGPGRGATG